MTREDAIMYAQQTAMRNLHAAVPTHVLAVYDRAIDIAISEALNGAI
jgi:hypothetical protein